MKIIHYANLKPWNAKVPYAEEWWTIYHYLNLSGKDEKNIFYKSLSKQKKYKKLFFVSIVTNVILLAILFLARG